MTRRREQVRAQARATLLERAQAWTPHEVRQEFSRVRSERRVRELLVGAKLETRKVWGKPWWLLLLDGVEVGAAQLDVCLVVYGVRLVAEQAKCESCGQLLPV